MSGARDQREKKVEDVPACCNSRPWHATFAESVARSWLLMTQNPTHSLPFLTSWKLQQAALHPQGCLLWEIA